jgi:uncharacterized linocin/CFP29 family protein
MPKPDIANVNAAGQVMGTGRLNLNAQRPYLNEQGQPRIVGNNGKPLVANDGALLRYDEWKDIDTEVVKVATDRLVGVRDLQARGLIHNLGSIGITLSQWEEESDMTAADVSMSGITEAEGDTPAWNLRNVPVPIFHKDFQVNIRRLEASRMVGESIDVTAASIAARRVSERSEDMLFAGEPIVVQGNNLYGYTNLPGRNQVDLDTNWDATAQNDNPTIIDDVNAMLQAARDDKHFGPFVLYVPTGYEFKLDEDYSDQYPRTVRDRIEALTGIERVEVADRLASNNVVLVQMTRDVVDLAIAQPISTIQWSTQGGMVENFKVMACWAARLKSDYDGRAGIVHLRPA